MNKNAGWDVFKWFESLILIAQIGIALMGDNLLAQKFSQFIVLLLAFILLPMIISCGNDILKSGDKSYTFSGVVSDSVTGLGIDSAIVAIEDTLGRLKFYSDSSGFYEGGSNAGSTMLFVQKSGFQTQGRQISLNKNLDSINFRLVH